jgi:hypothetical protein
MKIAVFWVVAPCSLIEVYQTTRCYNPEDSNLQKSNDDKSISVSHHSKYEMYHTNIYQHDI